jgi:hypothetical protein
MELSQKQREELWGDRGPYSEIRMCIETRILDDSVSRIFAVVEANINPTTYRIIKKNRDEFKDDEMIQQLLDHTDYRGRKHGYVICAFRRQLTDDDVMRQAQAHVEYTKKTLIKMHKYVMRILKNLDSI